MPPPHAKTIRARAYTSMANLGHGFDVMALALNVGFDEVSISEGGTGLELSVHGPHAGGTPQDALANTAGRAVAAVLKATGSTASLRIEVMKGTRPGSGLGSSAASAAAAVLAVDALHGLKLDRERLVQFAGMGEAASAGTPHYDNVAAAMLGGFVVVSVEGKASRHQGIKASSVDTNDHLMADTLDASMPGCLVASSLLLSHILPPTDLRIVIALPRLIVSTHEARAVLPKSLNIKEHCLGVGRSTLAAMSLCQGDLRMFGRAIEGSFCDQARAPLVPGFEAVCAAARNAGAYGVSFSGSGPAVGAVIGADCDGPAIASAMKRAFADVHVEADTHIATAACGAEIIESRT